MTFQDDTQKQLEVTQPVHHAQSKLKVAMQREISFMREMLSSMQKEQDTLLLNNTYGLKIIMKEREELFEHMVHARNDRMKGVKLMAKALNFEDDGQWEKGSTLDELLTTLGTEGCEVLWLRDQMLALLQKMNDQNSRNNYLIQNRIRHTKELMRRLHPYYDNHLYSDDGKYAKKNTVTTIALVNQEG